MQTKKLKSNCISCRKEFYSYKIGERRQSFCSRICYNNSRWMIKSNKSSKKNMLVCGNCNKEFSRYKVEHRPQKFCSRSCYLNSDQNRDLQKKRMSAMKGEKNYGWKGKLVGYKGIHRWIEINFGKAKGHECSLCFGKSGSITMNWMNIDHKYTRDRDKWIVACKICHSRYDQKKFKIYSKKKL